LESAGLGAPATDHACLDGFLSAEMVVTLFISRQKWREILINTSAIITDAHMVQDHWVSNNMLYLNITNNSTDLPQLPYNLLSQAILQSQPRGRQPQRVRIQIAEQPRLTSSRDEEWRRSQCLALLLQFHIGLNAADLAAVMGWLREYQLPCSIPPPEDQFLRLVYPYVTEALQHIDNFESEVTRPRTARLLSKRTDRKWAIVLTSPPGSKSRGNAAILPRTSIATFPSFFCPRIAPMGAGESCDNWCNRGLDQGAGLQVFVGLARYGAAKSRRGGHFFLVACPSEPTISQMEAVRDTVRSQIQAQSQSGLDLDLLFAAFQLSGPLFPQQHFQLGSVTQVQAVACWESMQGTKVRKLEIKKILKPGPLPEAIILCRTSSPFLSQLCAFALPQLRRVFRALEAEVPGGRQFSRFIIILEAVSATKVPLDSRKVNAQLPSRFVFASSLDRIVRQPGDVITLLRQTHMGENLFVLDDGPWLNMSIEYQRRFEEELEKGKANSC
jgi:hypothetical protein